MAVAALVTWILAAGFGFFMLGRWLSLGGARAGAASHFRPPVVFGHFALAAGGLIVWVVYVIADTRALAWVAFADLVAVAALGELLVYRWAKDRRATTGTSAAAGVGRRGTTGTMTAQSTGTQLAEQRIPVVVVALHGLLAVSTVVLVLLSALEVGGS